MQAKNEIYFIIFWRRPSSLHNQLLDRRGYPEKHSRPQRIALVNCFARSTQLLQSPCNSEERCQLMKHASIHHCLAAVTVAAFGCVIAPAPIWSANEPAA